MADKSKQARGWWVPSKRFPVRILDVMVLVGAVAALVLLALTIMGFSMASSRGDALEAAQRDVTTKSDEISRLDSGHRAALDAVKADLKKARDAIAALEARPTAEEFGIAKTEAASWKEKAETAAAQILARERELEDARAGVADLERKNDALKKGMSTSDRSKREFYEQVQELSEGLKKQTVKSYDLGQKLRLTNDRLDAAEASAKDLQAQLAETREELAKRERVIANLKREFGDIPIVPLPGELAKVKWQEIQKAVASREERDDRIDLLFRAKLVLAGTKYESQANANWQRECKERQASLNREASVVYGNVTGKIRNTPDAHEANLRLLAEALAKVKGSRYEERVQRLIDREKALVGGE